jgi:hypothetical protein
VLQVLHEVIGMAERFMLLKVIGMAARCMLLKVIGIAARFMLLKVIGMAARAGMLFAALSLAKTSPHRRPSRSFWHASYLGVCDHFGGVKQYEWMTDMAVGPTRALQLAAVSGDRAGMA